MGLRQQAISGLRRANVIPALSSPAKRDVNGTDGPLRVLLFDQRRDCLADRSPRAEPREHRAGSESLFTGFWGLRVQTMRGLRGKKTPPARRWLGSARAEQGGAAPPRCTPLLPPRFPGRRASEGISTWESLPNTSRAYLSLSGPLCPGMCGASKNSDLSRN